MLRELVVEGLAVIEHASLELGPGFTVLTGETGAGKSLVADALALALGARADSTAVRAGSAKAVVTLAADLSDAPRAAAVCQELGFEPEDGVVVLTREVGADGRSAARVNGRPATVQSLRAIGAEMVDLHGQHQHQALLDRARHIGFLDDWAGEEVQAAREACRKGWEALRAAEQRAEELRAALVGGGSRLELARHDLREIEAASPAPGEAGRLKEKLARAAHAERAARALHASLDLLDDGEASASERLQSALREIGSVRGLLPEAGLAAEEAEAAAESLRSAVRALREALGSLEADPGQAEAWAERLDALQGLMRKHGTDEEGLALRAEQLAEEVAGLEGAGAALAEAERDVEGLRATHLAACARLTALRAALGGEFAEKVTEAARELAMQDARFLVRITPGSPGPDGADDVSFWFSANAGEPESPLEKAASGGEASRLMLAVKSVSAGRAGVPSVVFDEIDAGLSGRAAGATAEMLSAMGRSRQVVAITHLPQIAARADRHLSVRKRTAAGRTVTEVVALDRPGRVEELARLVGGAKPGEAARANAEELMAARLS